LASDQSFDAFIAQSARHRKQISARFFWNTALAPGILNTLHAFFPEKLAEWQGSHAHLAEIMAETRLHEGARGGIEGLAGGAKRLVDDRRRGSGTGARGSGRFALERFFTALLAFAIGAGFAAAGTLALKRTAGSGGESSRRRGSPNRAGALTHRDSS
jgi:hypothetical protein